MTEARHLDPARPVRRWITFGLAGAGAATGAIVGVALTVIGKVVAGAPPADAANYLWNAGVFAAVGACLAPAVTWASLRDVPLWRAVAEPLAGALLGMGIGALLGTGAFLFLTPIGAIAAVARLEIVHRPRALPRAK